MTPARTLLSLMALTLGGAVVPVAPAAAGVPAAVRVPRLSFGAFAPDGTTVIRTVRDLPGGAPLVVEHLDPRLGSGEPAPAPAGRWARRMPG